MTFKEAQTLLQRKENTKVLPSKGLSKEQELLLVTKLNSGIPVFVTDWPLEAKPFYMKCSTDNSTVFAFLDIGHFLQQIPYQKNIPRNSFRPE